MGILKKRDLKSQSSVHAEQNQYSMRQVSRRDRSGRSRSKAEAKSGSSRAFFEDFNLEHCFSYVSNRLAAFSGSSSALEPAGSRSSFGQDFRSPSCVYLG